jgi:hypothetical protein
MIKGKIWKYADPETQQWIGPYNRGELDELYQKGIIDQWTWLIDEKHHPRLENRAEPQIQYNFLNRVNVNFNVEVGQFIEKRKADRHTILSGRNNSGKTIFLKNLYLELGSAGYLVGCNRFYHVDTLGTTSQDMDQTEGYYQNFVSSLYRDKRNEEKNTIDLSRLITSLSDNKRNMLFSLCEEILGYSFSLLRVDPKNSFSPFYIDVDGENISVSSTGTRLLLTILGTIVNDSFQFVLIDEPELGLSPDIQVMLSKAFYDRELRNKYFPHIKHLYIATHSHLFLDREILSNNFIVERKEQMISIENVDSIGAFHRLQFKMLGNDFESIFLPSAIIIVEGESDVTFLKKIFELHIPQKKVTIVSAYGEGEITRKLHILGEAFGGIHKSPYRNRIFIVIDEKYSLRPERIEKMGLPNENIIIWSKNGIEYYYPKGILASLFSCSEIDVDNINLEKDPISFNDISFSKKKLSILVSGQIHSGTKISQELMNYVDKIKKQI